MIRTRANGIALIAMAAFLISEPGQGASLDAGRHEDASAPWLPPIPSVDEKQVATWQQQAWSKPNLAARMDWISRHLRYLPYGRSPLGEGSGQQPDPDPRFRVDRFDCTTLVETVLALARTTSLDEARDQLDRIRYSDGKIDFAHRRHLPMAQWIPELIAQGVLTDVTHRVAGKQTRWANKKIDQESWQARKKNLLPQLPHLPVAPGVRTLPVVSPDDALAIEDRIPGGLILSVVRVDHRFMPIRITHQGLLIRRSSGLYIRHAIGKKVQRVIDERFDHFARRNLGYKKWPVTGFNLLRPVDPSPPKTR